MRMCYHDGRELEGHLLQSLPTYIRLFYHLDDITARNHFPELLAREINPTPSARSSVSIRRAPWFLDVDRVYWDLERKEGQGK